MTGFGESVTLCLLGDMMPGRGVDQILPHPGDPALREPAVDDARFYVGAADERNGTIERPVDFEWPWGDALRLMDEFGADLRVMNVESSITDRGVFAADKSVHYRASPANVRCVAAGRPDLCVLANNHVLDFGVEGLTDTIETLSHAGLRYAGAGYDAAQAALPVTLPVGGGDSRVLAVACATESAGVPAGWAAGTAEPGVHVLPELSENVAARLAERLRAFRRAGDLTLVSIHWGSNWGYRVPRAHVRFARHLVDEGVDAVYGHSSHHPRPIEVYRDRLILYGCGDFVNDYEGIGGHEQFRDDLRPLYFPEFERETGRLTRLRVAVTQACRMRLQRTSTADIRWMCSTLSRISEPFGSRFQIDTDDSVLLVAGARQG